MCRRGEMKLEKISSELQASYSLTKSTPLPLFAAHRDVVMGCIALLLHSQGADAWA
eukprot:CAMPEP_0181291718 /NCGR_PEP_ID=MMETSP1101-20121128/2119_1 /TAXON_ID=46948 /ORGANISM="Rhodomonas abbreviata, Strain Caron Lab Isolate" /LENGTH=55 /DNA_ID=CAMNT_0023396133 /DNA_START=284 /DNA_END=451 /DNA_ORIENTATION=-